MAKRSCGFERAVTALQALMRVTEPQITQPKNGTPSCTPTVQMPAHYTAFPKALQATAMHRKHQSRGDWQDRDRRRLYETHDD